MQETIEKTKMEIKKDMTIAEIFESFPDKIPRLAEVMTNAGLHCIGCHANVMETIEQGCLGHGMPKEVMNKLINDLNKAVEEEDSVEGLKVTDKAVKKIKELMKSENADGYGLRVSVMPGGCAGFQYGLDFEEKAGKEDKVMEFSNLKVFVDSNSYEFLKGTVLDYTEGLQGSGFKFNNPKAKSSCGCGKSVGF